MERQRYGNFERTGERHIEEEILVGQEWNTFFLLLNFSMWSFPFFINIFFLLLCFFIALFEFPLPQCFRINPMVITLHAANEPFFLSSYAFKFMIHVYDKNQASLITHKFKMKDQRPSLFWIIWILGINMTIKYKITVEHNIIGVSKIKS